MTPARLLRFGLVLGALLLAACGGDDDAKPTATATTTTTSEATPAAVATTASRAACVFADAAERAVAASALVITRTGYGTAFHVGDGRFVTAAHVVSGETSVLLESDIFSAEGSVVGIEPEADVAMIEVDPALVGAIETLAWFEGDRVRIGDSVGTAGYPVDVSGAAAVTRGTVSKIATSGDGTTVIQTDAPINPGNSGGALFNECGDVIGVVVQKWSEAGVEGVAYATAYNTALAALAKARPPTQVSTGPDGSFGDGTYVVGVDIDPGVWQNSDSSEFCYWERLSGFTEDEELGFGHVNEDIIESDTSFEIQTVEILPSDAGFYSLDCGVWALVGPSSTPVGELRSPYDLVVGDCFSVPPQDGELIFDVLVVPCDEAHDHEMYDVYLAGDPGDTYPGDEAIDELWLDLCIGSFEDFAGIAYEDSRLDVGALIPTADSWLEGDREIACYVSDLFGDPLFGSMRGRGE